MAVEVLDDDDNVSMLNRRLPPQRQTTEVDDALVVPSGASHVDHYELLRQFLGMSRRQAS